MVIVRVVAVPPPSVETLLAFDPAGASILAPIALALGALYLAGAVRLWVQKRRWSVLRTLSFMIGCAILFVCGSLGLNRYLDSLVSVLVFQQITLMTVVAPLLIVGSPGRLLLRATPHRGIGTVVLRIAHAGLRSPITRAALHPIVAILIAAALYLGLYLSDLVSVIVSLPLGADALVLTFLGAGVLAAVPLWSSDPLPRTPSYAARLADVIIEIQIHAVFGLILLLSPVPLFAASAGLPAAWGIDALTDQAIAGTLAWTYAELPLLVVLIVTLSRWRSRDLTVARRRQTASDAELEEYNAYLASLDAR